MLRIKNRGFNRSYVYGGSGIFDSIAKTISSVIGKEAVKRAVQKAATEAGKKLGEKAVSSLTSKSKEILNKQFKSPLTSQSQEILRKYTAPIKEEFNLNNLIAGSAIRIEDYIKTNKFGLKRIKT